MRLGEAKEAAQLLETVTNQFSTNYGIHANLGTAYHLLGRYADAEREIGRDLEINPDAHFGLERYHLALLQYLSRDTNYQTEHVYVDEWSLAFFMRPGVFLGRPESKVDDQGNGAALPDFPAYRRKWDLAADPKFKDGILYMATMNPNEPACFEMLGIACLKDRKFNLAEAAFKRAIRLGSLQAEMLQKKVDEIQNYISKSDKLDRQMKGMVMLLSLIPLSIILYVVLKFRDYLRKIRQTKAQAKP